MDSPATSLAFDPDAATVIREPEGVGYGYWAGGHKVSYDPASGSYVLFYRLRSPLEEGRGGVARVAVSDDGVSFDDVWEVTKDQLAASSIEAGHCVRHDDGEWRCYLSYELAGPRPYWRVDVLRGPSPDALDVQGRRTVLLPADYGLHSIKDPWVLRDGDGGYLLHVCIDPPDRPVRTGNLIRAGSRDATARAASDDGLIFPSIEEIYRAPVDDSWHGRRGRVNCLFPYGDGLVGTLDGGRTYYDNFEERCGLVTSADGHRIEVVDTGGPWVASRHGPVRYAWGLRVGQRLLWYVEATRADGSHDLRVAEVAIPDGR